MMPNQNSHRSKDMPGTVATGRASFPAEAHNQEGRCVMWGVITLFAGVAVTGVALTVVLLGLDPAAIGPVAGSFILACLVLCGVMAVADARQARATETTIQAQRVKQGGTP